MNLINKLKENLALKVLSLLISLLLWFVVIFHQQTEINATIPLRFDNLGEGLIIASDPPAEIALRITGSKMLMSNILNQLRPYTFDLVGEQPGSTVFEINKERIYSPLGSEISRYSPSTIELKIEPVLTRRLFVTADLVGKPAPGYKTANIEIKPDLVEIIGAKSNLQGLESIRTRPIDISNITKDLKLEASLDLGDFHIKKVSHANVKVTVNVVKKMDKAIFKNLPIRITGETDGVRVLPKNLTLVLFGPQIDLEKVSADTLDLRIDASSYPPGRHTVKKIDFTAPSSVSKLEQSPDEVVIIVPKK